MSQRDEKTGAILLGHGTLDGDTAAKEDSMAELARLADTAGILSLGTYVQRRGKIHPRIFIGEGFIETSLAHPEKNEADGEANLTFVVLSG